jgi:hypothetical protein
MRHFTSLRALLCHTERVHISHSLPTDEQAERGIVRCAQLEYRPFENSPGLKLGWQL